MEINVGDLIKFKSTGFTAIIVGVEDLAFGGYVHILGRFSEVTTMSIRQLNKTARVVKND